MSDQLTIESLGSSQYKMTLKKNRKPTIENLPKTGGDTDSSSMMASRLFVKAFPCFFTGWLPSGSYFSPSIPVSHKTEGFESEIMKELTNTLTVRNRLHNKKSARASSSWTPTITEQGAGNKNTLMGSRAPGQDSRTDLTCQIYKFLILQLLHVLQVHLGGGPSPLGRHHSCELNGIT